MSYASISDIHIKESGDFGEEILRQFFISCHEHSVETAFLIGDIFDLLVGSYEDYLDKYASVFNLIKENIDSGLKIIWIEGNHDFHINELVECFRKKHMLSMDKIQCLNKAFFANQGQKIIRFSHGDDIELGNLSYKIYKLFITSFFTKNLMKHLVPFQFVDWIGNKMSKASRARNEKKYVEYDDPVVKELFRKSAVNEYMKSEPHIIVCGHSHVKDHYINENFEYLNNGFTKATKCYVLIKAGKPSLEVLNC